MRHLSSSSRRLARIPTAATDFGSGPKKKITETAIPNMTLIVKFRRAATMTNEIMKMLKESLYLDVLRVKRLGEDRRSSITAFSSRNESGTIRTEMDALDEVMQEKKVWETTRIKNREEKEARERDHISGKGGEKPVYMNTAEQKEVQKRRYQSKYNVNVQSGGNEGKMSSGSNERRSQKRSTKGKKGKKQNDEAAKGKGYDAYAMQLPRHATYDPRPPSSTPTTPGGYSGWCDWRADNQYY